MAIRPLPHAGPPDDVRIGKPRYFLALSLLTPAGWLGGPQGYQEVTQFEAEQAREPQPHKERVT